MKFSITCKLGYQDRIEKNNVNNQALIVHELKSKKWVFGFGGWGKQFRFLVTSFTDQNASKGRPHENEF